MVKVAGIRFRKAGKIYYFDPSDLEINPGEHVIVETIRGIEYGSVVLASKEVEDEEVVQPLKKVLRIANDEDKEAEVKNKEKEREAFGVCKSKIIRHELNMKLIDCEYTFDNNKLLFYFTADGRVDFRDLVKDLASVFKTRIELRQIGVRDETKMIGSIGICGRTLCCHAYLADFHPVSIKMAKDQNLSLNPTKISGVCGRLMCCLKYEEDTYKELNKKLPRVGDKVRIKESGVIADVIKTNVIRQLVKIVIRKKDGDNEVVEMKLDELDLKRQGVFQPMKAADEVKTDIENKTDIKEEKSAVKSTEARSKRPSKPRNSSSNNNRQNQQGNKQASGKTKENDQSGNKPTNKRPTKKPNNNRKPQNTNKASKAVDQKQQSGDQASNTEKKSNNNRNKNRRPRNRSDKPRTDTKKD